MPRDGSGVYTLPSGNPVTTGTLIQSTWANPTMADIAVQLNNVLTRDGVLGPVLPFKLVDGTVAAPGLAFNSEPGLGWYRPGANQINMAVGNAVVAAMNGATPASVGFGLYPRAAGASRIQLNSDIYGTANTTQLLMEQNATEALFKSFGVGTGLAKPIRYTALSHIFEGAVPMVGALNGGRLVYTSNTVITYRPDSGNQVSIAGVPYTIPAAGITLTNAGMVTGTSYYIYLLQTAGVLSLESSTTGHVIDATYGQRIKSGDITRTLVGWVVPTAGNVFIDTPLRRQVASWANRKRTQCYVALGGNISTSSASPVELDATYRLNYLAWGGGLQNVYHSGAMNIISAVATGGFVLNHLTAGNLDAFVQFTASTPGYWSGANTAGSFVSPADGLNTIRVMGSTNGGQLVLQGSGTPGTRCALYADIEI